MNIHKMDLSDDNEKLLVELSKIQDLVETSENVRKLLECPVCLELPLPPIYLCRRGHIVCSSCQNKTVSCPLCRDSYSNARSFVAEGIVEKLCLPCKYQEDGCKTVMFGRDIVDHVKKCQYRPIRCMDCNTESHWVSFGQYFDHLKSKHKINGVSKTEGKVVYSLDKEEMSTAPPENKFCWPPYYFKCFGDKIFLARVHGNAMFVCIWVTLLGIEETCLNYDAHIDLTLYDGEKSSMLSWTGEVNHIRDDSPAEIITKGRGLILPLDTILQLASPSKKDPKYVSWTYFVRIFTKSEEAVTTVPEVPEMDELKIVKGKSTSKIKVEIENMSKKGKNKPSTGCTHIPESCEIQNGPIVNSIAPPTQQNQP